MTSHVSRRNFVALAGAGVALGACKNSTVDGSQSRTGIDLSMEELMEQQAKTDKIFGSLLKAGRGWKYPHHGHDPNESRSIYEVANPTGIIKKINIFDPKYIHIISIEDGSKGSSNPRKRWSIEVHHAHFSFSSNASDDETKSNARLQRAIEILDNKRPGPFSATNNSNNKPFNRKKPPEIEYAEDNIFNKIKYGSQHELFIYLDGPFLQLDPGILLSFAPNRISSGTASENYSFYGAQVVPLNSMGALWDQGRLFRVRNYFEDVNGDSITSSTETVYSMNVHFGVPNGASGSVPTIIDPDTGNGMGNTP